nr:SprT family zinc-dependent metalloprotease [Parerythrobacter lacustris]
MQAPAVSLGEQDVPLAIRRHPTARRMTMRLAPDGSEVRITIPRWGRTRDAVEFARSRAAWLAGQLAKIEPPQSPQVGGTLPFRGEELRIDWRADRRRRVSLTEGTLVVGGPQESFPARLERWLRAQARDLIEADMGFYCARAARPEPAIALSRAQRRWGSCSTSGTVRINWRLVMAPDAVRRSVVAHEVAHLVHFDHSPAFHALLGELFEGDLAAANRWLRDHGRSLYRHFG